MKKAFVSAISAFLFCAVICEVASAREGNPASGGGNAPEGKSSDVVAVVDGRELRNADLALVRLFVVSGQHGTAPSKEALLEQLVSMELVVRHAERRGLPSAGPEKELLQFFHDSTLGMEYSAVLRKNVRYDASDVADWLPKKWKVGDFEVVLFDTIDEARKSAESVRTAGEFEALKKRYPERTKSFDNVFPKSGFFNEYDDIAIFNRNDPGVYGAGETGIGPGVIRIRAIHDPDDASKAVLLKKASDTLGETTFFKEMERIRKAAPYVPDRKAIRAYVESVRSGSPIDTPVATMGSRTFRSFQIRHFVINEPVYYLKGSSVEEIVPVYVDILQRIADTLALDVEGKKTGYDTLREDKFKASYENFRRKYLYEIGLREGAGPAEATDAEARIYYEMNLKEKFTVGERVEVAHIFSKSKGVSQKALKRIKAGETFEAVAKDVSEDPQTSSRGGRIGWVFKDGKVIREIEKQSFALKDAPGKVSPIVKTKNGYHLLKVLSYYPTEVTPIEKALPVARLAVQAQKFEAGKKKFLEGLRADAKIKTYPERVSEKPGKGHH